MRNSSSLKGLLLGVLLAVSATTFSATNVTGKWSGTLQVAGETDTKPAYMILKQDGDKLSGSGGPTESEQHPFDGGKVEGNKLTFDVPLGEKSMHFEMEANGDQITGQVSQQNEGATETAKISLKRVTEK